MCKYAEHLYYLFYFLCPTIAIPKLRTSLKRHQMFILLLDREHQKYR